jgi:hypothetical protein
MRILSFSIALALSWAVIGSAPPYEGYDIIWEDSFEGPAGSLPDTSNWIMQEWFKDLNGDWQTYTTNPENQQLTGQGSLLISPLRDSSATKGWTSGRLESAYTFTPAPGARTIAEASIKLGSAPASGKQGIWSAFWLLGDSHRRGTLIWPACGEIDIMENVNGETKTQGVIHCDKNPGGICNEKNGIPGAIALPDAGSGFHTYTAVIDRTPGNWMEESVTFFLDGVQYHQVTGARINDEEVWGKIAHNLIHFILNVAVGGEWVSKPLRTKGKLLTYCSLVTQMSLLWTGWKMPWRSNMLLTSNHLAQEVLGCIKVLRVVRGRVVMAVSLSLNSLKAKTLLVTKDLAVLVVLAVLAVMVLIITGIMISLLVLAHTRILLPMNPALQVSLALSHLLVMTSQLLESHISDQVTNLHCPHSLSLRLITSLGSQGRRALMLMVAQSQILRTWNTNGNGRLCVLGRVKASILLRRPKKVERMVKEVIGTTV